MTITFKYNNKQYTTNNLAKKLNKLGISEKDIELLGNKDLGDIDDSIKRYYFINKDNGYRICSIYDECPKGYVKCTKEEYGNLRSNIIRN